MAMATTLSLKKEQEKVCGERYSRGDEKKRSGMEEGRHERSVLAMTSDTGSHNVGQDAQSRSSSSAERERRVRVRKASVSSTEEGEMIAKLTANSNKFCRVVSEEIGHHCGQGRKPNRKEEGPRSSEHVGRHVNDSSKSRPSSETRRRKTTNRTFFATWKATSNSICFSPARSSPSPTHSVASPVAVRTPEGRGVRRSAYGNQQTCLDCSHSSSDPHGGSEGGTAGVLMRSSYCGVVVAQEKRQARMDLPGKVEQRRHSRQGSLATRRQLAAVLVLASLVSLSNLGSLFAFFATNLLASSYRLLSCSTTYHNEPSTIHMPPSFFSLLCCFFPLCYPRSLTGFNIFSSSSSFCTPRLSSQQLAGSLFSPQTLPQMILATAALPENALSSLVLSSTFGEDARQDLDFSALRRSREETEAWKLHDRMSARRTPTAAESAAARESTVYPEDKTTDGLPQEESKKSDANDGVSVGKVASGNTTAIQRRRQEEEEAKNRKLRTEENQGPFSLLRGGAKTSVHPETPAYVEYTGVIKTRDNENAVDTRHSLEGKTLSPSLSLRTKSSSALLALPRLLSASSSFSAPLRSLLPRTVTEEDLSASPRRAHSSPLASSSSPPPHASSSLPAMDSFSSASSPPSSLSNKKASPTAKRRLVQLKKKADTVVVTKSIPTSASTPGGAAETAGPPDTHGRAPDATANSNDRGGPKASSSTGSLFGGGGGVYHREHTGATRPWIW